ASDYPERGSLFLRVPAYIALSDAQARVEADIASRRRWWVSAATARRLETMTYEDTLKGTVLIGSPASMTTRIEHAAAGTWARWRADGAELRRIPHADVMTALRLLCQQVMPRFH